jgi:hypothetical protein
VAAELALIMDITVRDPEDDGRDAAQDLRVRRLQCLVASKRIDSFFSHSSRLVPSSVIEAQAASVPF